MFTPGAGQLSFQECHRCTIEISLAEIPFCCAGRDGNVACQTLGGLGRGRGTASGVADP
jgi:hypothetical protein